MDDEARNRARRRDELHIYEGIALAHLRWPEVSDLAYASETPDSFVIDLAKLLNIDEIQALAVADMQVRRLGRLERESIQTRLVSMRNELGDG